MPNATQILRQDHKKVKDLFNKFEQGKAVDAKRRVAEQAMNELEVHAQVEEEIFYPAVKKAIDESELVDEAKQEHQEAKSLIRQLRNMKDQDTGQAGGDFASKFAELVQAIQHHVAEEEGEMFPKVEDSELDLADLGAQMAERKQELMQEMGVESPSGTRSKSKVKSKVKTKTKTKTKAKTKSAPRPIARSKTARQSSRAKRSRAR